MVQQDILDQVYSAVEEASFFIDDLAGDGEGLSMTQVNAGMAAVLALGAVEADLQRLGQVADPESPTHLATYQATLSRAAAALAGARDHIASYQPTGELAGDVAQVTAFINQAIAAIETALV